MKHVRKSGRLLAALLALLMVLSTVIALPVVAEESSEASTETSVIPNGTDKVPLYSFTFPTGDADKSVSDTDAYLLANGGFSAGLLSSGAFTTTGLANYIDKDGFYRIVSQNTYIAGYDRTTTTGEGEEAVTTTTTVPKDFFNLFYGLYDNFDRKGVTYTWEFDFRYLANKTPNEKNDTADVSYTDAENNVYTGVYTRDVGHSFFAGIAGGNYNSLFRITGDGYMYNGGSEVTVTKANAKEYGNLYVVKADKSTLAIADDTGSFSDDTNISISNVVDREKAYQLTANTNYHVRVEFEIVSADTADKDRTIHATVYVAPKDGSAEEYCIGTQAYYYDNDNVSIASKNVIRLTDSGNNVLAVGGTWDIYTNVLFYEDLSTYTAASTVANVQTNLKNTMAVGTSFATDGSVVWATSENTSTFSGGYLTLKGNQAAFLTNTDKSNPVYELLTGTFSNVAGTESAPYYQTYFFEFGFKSNAFATTSSTSSYHPSVTITKGETEEPVTLSTDHYDTGNGYIFRDRTNTAASPLSNKWMLRITAGGDLYLGSAKRGNLTTDVASGVDGYYYYTGTVAGVSTTVYFDANGYRYTKSDFEGAVEKDGKYYLDDPADAAPTVSSGTLDGMLKPQYYANSYQLEKGKAYRMGILYSVTAPVTATYGRVTVGYTVYVKEDGAEHWEKCLGTSSYYSYTTGPQASQQIVLSGVTGAMSIGDEMVAYTYTCDAATAKHPSGMVTGRGTTDTGLPYTEHTCAYCNDTWKEINGVRYTTASVSNSCTGSYTLWTAHDGSGYFFKTDVTAGDGNHTLNTVGVCSKCGYCPAWETFPMNHEAGTQNRYTTSAGTVAKVAQDYNNDGNVTAPAYDATNGYIDAPDSGMVLRNFPTSLYDYASPFVISMDFWLEAGYASGSTSSSTKPWELLTYRNGVGNTSTYMQLVGVQMNEDEEGNATKPYLTLGVDSDKKLCDLNFQTWYNIQIVSAPAWESCRIYLNGEYMGTGAGLDFASGATAAALCIGIQTQTGPYCFGYKVKNISFEAKTLAEIHDVDASNQLYSLRYDRYANQAELKNITSLLGTFSGKLAVDEYTEGNSIVGGKYGLLTIDDDQYREVSLSTTYYGEEFGLSGKKYEIMTKFAVSSTDEFRTGKGDNLVRLSKYNDAIQTVLMKYGSDGQYYAGAYKLYDKNGDKLSILRDFDENDVPTGVTELRVVVDEKNNKYSVYIDGNMAYFWTGNAVGSGEFLPFYEQEMPTAQLGKTDTANKYTPITEVDTYGAVTKAIADAHGYKGPYQYMRLFRNITTVAVEEISLTLIPDSDIEFIGAQKRNSDDSDAVTEGTFDLRFLFGIDDLYTSGLGFDITAFWNEGGVQKSSTTQDTDLVTAVYEAVVEDEEYFYAYECSEGDYLAAFKILGITELDSTETYTFHITPYTIGADDTKVPSATTYVVTCNGQGGSIQSQILSAE